jgi:hypothetical protein
MASNSCDREWGRWKERRSRKKETKGRESQKK